uniref:Uncharacterized protein n=1 Tax=Panagrolaimus sp. ES5 TaxID=591445 RepID=A0AC34FIQ7_9BILA
MSLAAVRNPHEALEGEEAPSRWRRKCVYKNDPSARRILHQSLEAGDAAAREYLFHRFLLICSLFGDIMFFLASMRIDNRYVHGIVDVYQQRIGFAFYIHLSAALIFFFAVIAAIIAAYFLLRADYLENGCCHSKNDSLRTHLEPIPIDSYPLPAITPCNQEFSFISTIPKPPPPKTAVKPNGRSATVVRMNLPEDHRQHLAEEEGNEDGSETTEDAEVGEMPKTMAEIKCRWGRRSSYDKSFPTVSKI